MYKTIAAALTGVASFAYIQDTDGEIIKGLGAPQGTKVPALLAFMPGKSLALC
jgi:hypothetical protein